MKRLSSLLLLVIALFAVPVASANGNNQVIFLTYLPEVSNTGNQAASGIAVVDLHTGEVSIQATGLSPLEGQHYEIWLTGPNLSNPVRVAALPSDGQMPTLIVPGLPTQEYRYVLLTVEADGGEPTAPSESHSLAGVFPNAEAVAPLPGVGSSGQTVEGEPPAAALPTTGALLPDRWVALGGLGLGVIVAFLAGWLYLRKVRRSERRERK